MAALNWSGGGTDRLVGRVAAQLVQSGEDVAATPSPTSTARRLIGYQAISLVADRLSKRLALIVTNNAAVSFVDGRWRVTYQDAQWDVDDLTGQVYTANTSARRMEQLP